MLDALPLHQSPDAFEQSQKTSLVVQLPFGSVLQSWAIAYDGRQANTLVQEIQGNIV